MTHSLGKHDSVIFQFLQYLARRWSQISNLRQIRPKILTSRVKIFENYIFQIHFQFLHDPNGNKSDVMISLKKYVKKMSKDFFSSKKSELLSFCFWLCFVIFISFSHISLSCLITCLSTIVYKICCFVSCQSLFDLKKNFSLKTVLWTCLPESFCVNESDMSVLHLL